MIQLKGWMLKLTEMNVIRKVFDLNSHILNPTSRIREDLKF